MLGGPWGAAAGAALPGWLMGVGDIRGELEDAGMDEGAAMDALVLGGAMPYAAADVLMPARVGRALASQGAARGLGPLLKGALRGGAEETFAEGAQSLISQGAAAIGADAPIDVDRIKEEAIRGGAAGVFLGAGGQAASGVMPERTDPPLLARAIETAKEIAARGTAVPATAPTPEATEAPQPTPVPPQVETDPWDTLPLPETSRAPEAVEGEIAAPETTAPIRETDAAIRETPTWARERLVDEDPETIDPRRRQRSVFPGDDRKVETVYTVADADQLRASHTSGYAQRGSEEFPPEIQGRAYHGRRGRQAREHTEQIVSGFDVERALDPTSSVAEGPPVATPDGIIVAGNGRIIAQQRLYETEAGASELKQGVERRAAELGIDPAQVAAVAKPVLFRQIVDPDVDVTNIDELRTLNESSDAPIGKTKDPLSEAAGKAAQFREASGALDHFAATADPDATIRSYLGTKGGRDFLGKLVEDGVITKGERARFADAATGVATEEGRQLIERMFYATALGDADVISRAPPAVLRTLDTSLPAIIRADRIGDGWEIGPLVKETVDLLSAARAGDMKLGDLVAQIDLEQDPPSEHAVDMARFLESGKGAVRDAFRAYANQAEAFTRQSASEDMFGHEPTGAGDARRIFGEGELAALAPLAPRRMSPEQARRQLLEAVQQPLFGEAEISTAGRRPRPTVDDAKYRELKGKQRVAAYEADLAEWEGGTLTNLPRGSEYAPAASEGPQSDVFQEQQSIFGLAPREAAADPEARREWDELGEALTEEDRAERQGYFESIEEERKNPAVEFTAKELEAAKNEPDEGTGFDIPEIRAARVRRDNAPQKTDEIKAPERDALRERLAEDVYNADIENRKRNREAWIVLGPPGSGKTTAAIAELKREQGALEVDSDIVKEGLPEFEGGMNAQGVHRESADIIEQRVLPRAIEAGDNLAIPRVGTREGTVTQLISDLKANGYTTHLVLANLSPIKSAARVVLRFLRGGRFVDPVYARHVGTKPAEVYERLKNDPAIATFKSVDTDVPFGTPPRLVEEGSNESQEQGSLRLRRRDGGGVRPSGAVEGGSGQETGRGRGRKGEAQLDLLEGRHPLAPREQAPLDPATEPSLVTISEELTTAERELRHLRVRAQGQPTEGGPTAAEGIADAENEVGRLEQEYEAEAERMREERSSSGVHPLAPTAQLSEQLPSAGLFTEGTVPSAPKSVAIVRDLQKVLHR